MSHASSHMPAPSHTSEQATTHSPHKQLTTASTHPYLRVIEEDTADRKATAQHPEPLFTGADSQLLEALEQHTDSQRDALTTILHDLHQHPEVAFTEHHAVRTLTTHLEKHHITAELPAFGLDTAFQASITSADYDPHRHRSIAILSEYDALPEIGHGCGHNVIAVAGLGAFIALARLLDTHPHAFSGRVVYLGTPAEEGEGGKELMARAGAFDNLDAALMVHSYFTDVTDQVWLGRRECAVTFTGHAAHASSHPFLGKNALDAATLAYHGLGLLRQQTPPVDRIHAIITEGGQRPNIITESASMAVYVRSPQPDTLKYLSDRVTDVFVGAARMVGVEVDITWDESPATLPVRSNTPLTERWVQAQHRRGRHTYPLGVISEVLAASTDFGNISYRVPGIHPLIKIADDTTGLHTREFAAAAASPLAETAALDGAFGLAATALDFLYDDVLAAAVHEDFENQGGFIAAEEYFHS